MNHTEKESIITSKGQLQYNKLLIKSHELRISLSFYKYSCFISSKLYDKLKEKYPNIYKEIRDECIKEDGKPLTKKEFEIRELKKLGKDSGKMIVKKLSKVYDITEDDLNCVEDVV